MRNHFNDVLETLASDAPAVVDLTNPDHLQSVTDYATEILGMISSRAELVELERQLAESTEKVSAILALSAKVALSKLVISELSSPIHVSVVFAVYKEHERILDAAAHPHGENFLIRKRDQLRWLFDGAEGCDWDLTVVDDGCPEGSGRIAEAIISEQTGDDKMRVLYLDDAIREGLPVAASLSDSSESQKGGSIHFGMWDATRRDRANHIVAFTDADLSTHLGQVGLLVDRIVNDGFDVAIGSRRELNSVVVKQGARNTRGKLFIYLWKRLLPELSRIVDTQCGFKAFRSEVAREIVVDCIEPKFAFDIELLLKSELRREGSISKVGIGWLDSEAASTTTDLAPYLSMLCAMVAMYRRYGVRSSESERFADFIESLSTGQFDFLVEHVPDAIAMGDPADFGHIAVVGVDEMKAVIARM